MKSEAVSSGKAHFSLGKGYVFELFDVTEIGSPILPIIDKGGYELVKNDLGFRITCKE